MFQMLTGSDFRRLDSALPFVESLMGFANAESPPSRNEPVLYPAIGFLQQSVYGCGYGTMLLAYRTTVENTAQIDIVGTNYVPNSSFKIRLSGKIASNPDAPLLTLFTTPPVVVNSTSEELQTILLLAAQGVSLPIKRKDVVVTLGNPMSSINLQPAYTPEIDNTVDPPLVYLGSWLIRIEGNLTRLYNQLTFQVITDNTAFMRGSSAIIYRPAKFVPGTTTKVVFDPFNRPIDYPWKVGTLCVAIPFIGTGYGIIASDFRDQSILLPTAEPQE